MCLIVFSGYSQNIKKIYKSIKNNELVEAILESSKTDSKVKFDENENVLFQLSQCLLQSNSNSTVFKPYEAYNLFKSISINKLDEINDYLNKYELSINKIQDLIYAGVVYEAKKVNTEYSYKKALEICKPCSYENELIDLKTSSAFKEAKNIMSLTSLNKFINKYATSKFADLAVDIRDSLIYENSNKDYSSLLRFTKEYPNSKLTPKVILELPDVLYKEATKSNDYEKLVIFSKLYPNDSKILDVKKRIEEKEYYEISINKVNGWDINDCNINIEYVISKVENKREDNKVGNSTIGKLFKVSKDGNYGILNSNGKLISEIKFNEISDFINDYSIVSKGNKNDEYGNENEKFGFINLNGEEIVKNEYDRVFSSFVNGTSLVRSSQNFMIIDTTGATIKTLNIKSDRKSDKNIRDVGNGYFLILQRTQKVGDPEGEKDYDKKTIIIDKIGKEIYTLNDCEARNNFVLQSGYVAFGCNSNIAYSFDTKKGLLYGFEFSKDIELKVIEGNFVMKKDNKLALSDYKFKQLTPFKYDEVKFEFQITTEKESYLAAVKIKNKWALINNLGHELTTFKYDEIKFSNFGLISAKHNNKWGLINHLGQEITPFKYDEIDFESNGFAEAKIYKYTLEELNYNEEKYIKENRNCKWALINNLGQEITPFIYDYLNSLNTSLFEVSFEDKFGLINTNGQQVIPFKYNSEDIMKLVDGYFALRNNDKWAIFNDLGNKVTEFIYDEIINSNFNKFRYINSFNTTSFSNNNILVKQGCEWKIVKLKTRSLNSQKVQTYKNVELENFNLSETRNKNESNKIVEKVNNNITTLNQSKTDIIYDIVDESTEFPGGMNAFYNSLNSKIIIPKVAEDNNLSGSCYIKFIVRSDGSLTDVMITRGIPNCKECDDAIIKAIKESPKWIAGKIAGKSVNSQMQIKIDFNK